MKRTPSVTALAAIAGTAAITLAGCSSSSSTGSSSSSSPTATTSTALTVRTIFSGKAQGWTQPDDLAAIGNHLFVGFQNGVDSKGGTAGKPQNSTLVEFELNGNIDHSWPITGKIDGLGADAANSRVVATVNEDGNSSLYTVGLNDGAVKHYTYSVNPLPHGGGTDSVVADGGALYISASAPSGATGPAVFKVTLQGTTAQIATPAPFNINSAATTVGSGKSATLALTDPDSSTMVPSSVPVVGGELMLDSQGDNELIFDKLGQSGQPQVLKVSQSVDDVAFPTASGGTLISADSKTDSVDAITGSFTAGSAYTAVTPGNANNAPSNPAPNYFGTINLATGDVAPIKTQGVTLTPHSMLYLP